MDRLGKDEFGGRKEISPDNKIKIQLSKRLEEKLESVVDLDWLERRSLEMSKTYRVTSLDELLGLSVDDLREFTIAMDALIYIAMREPTKTGATKTIIDFMTNSERKEIKLKEFLAMYYLYTTVTVLLSNIVRKHGDPSCGAEEVVRMFGGDRIEVA